MVYILILNCPQLAAFTSNTDKRGKQIGTQSNYTTKFGSLMVE